jgi:hypothetical protein
VRQHPPSDVQNPGKKCTRSVVPASSEHLSVWQKFGGDMPELRDVALRLLSAHATSAASERNWCLWESIYCTSQSSLGMERAMALIAICAAKKAKTSPSEEFELKLSVIEGTD